MIDYKLAQGQGKWYKGNLHCHSTVSDGTLTPAEIVELYKSKGYSFLMFSEHDLYTYNEQFNSDDFLILPGTEKAHYVKDKNIEYHLLSIEDEDGIVAANGGRHFAHNEAMKAIDAEPGKTVMDTIDYLRENNNLVILNHPTWSSLDLEDIKDIDNIIGLEIFNYSCEQENLTGNSVYYWDKLLRTGKNLFGFATDDNHNKNYYNDVPAREWDSCGGWISVYAEALTKNAVVKSIKEGKFYSSNGPEIYNIEIKDGMMHVECSPCEAVYFLTYPRYAYSRRNSEGGPVTETNYALDGTEMYVRVECRDKNGKVAWSNPIFVIK